MTALIEHLLSRLYNFPGKCTDQNCPRDVRLCANYGCNRWAKLLTPEFPSNAGRERAIVKVLSGQFRRINLQYMTVGAKYHRQHADIFDPQMYGLLPSDDHVQPLHPDPVMSQRNCPVSSPEQIPISPLSSQSIEIFQSQSDMSFENQNFMPPEHHETYNFLLRDDDEFNLLPPPETQSPFSF